MASETSFQSQNNVVGGNGDRNHQEKKRPSTLWWVWAAALGFYLFIQFRHLKRVHAYDTYYNSLESELNAEFARGRKVNETSISSVHQNQKPKHRILNLPEHPVAKTKKKTNKKTAEVTLKKNQPPTLRKNWTSFWTNAGAVRVDDGNLQVEFFDQAQQRKKGMAGCLVNLEDTIRLAEWLPYHYATLPLGSVVIALDPKNSDRGIERTLELIDLWKDKIEITVWPDYFLPKERIFRKEQSYTRHRQVYFANQCLAYHKQQNRTWTLLTDNDEYLTFNYVHDDESLAFDHPAANKTKIKRILKKNRKKFMPLRKHLPMQNESTVLDFLHETERKMSNKNATKTKRKRKKKRETSGAKKFFPTCIRLPGIRYGGDRGVNATSVDHKIIEPRYLTTLRDIHHERRQSKFSKVIIDASNVKSGDLEWSKENNARTIHNPSKACGPNGSSTSGADYPSSLFRLNHYLGTLESYLERAGDYRKRDPKTYKEKAKRIKPSGSNWDTDITSWVNIFVRSVGGATEAKKLFAPLVAYQEFSYAETD